MSIPTSDWKGSKEVREKLNQTVIQSRNICTRLGRWIRLKMGMGDGVKV